jgi:rhomboid protease GluP
MFKEAYDRIIKNAICTNLIIVVNILVFCFIEWTGSSLDTEYMLQNGAAFAPYIVEKHQYFRLFTSMFLHFGIEHLFNNMLVLFFIGDILERNLGRVKYLIVYFVSGLAGSAVSCFFEYIQGNLVVSAGASGAIFGVIGALFYVVLINRGRIENTTSMQLGLLIIFSVYHGFSEAGIDNVAHIGGMFCGFLLAIVLYRRKKPSCHINDDIIQ